MNHSFNIEVAEKFGVDEAIMLENIAFWINKNIANKKHFYDGEYWTYNSTRAFTELFPYWTEKQIQRILKSLESKGLIQTSNYNKVAYDRTKWYGLTQKSKSIYSNGKMEILEKENGITEKVEPIPYINTDIKTNINISVDVKEIENHWNNKNRLTKIRGITKKRKEKTLLRIKETSLKEFLEAIDKLNNSDYATGNGKNNWNATYDWLVENDTNIMKVLEGNYDNKTTVKEKTSFTKDIAGYKLKSL